MKRILLWPTSGVWLTVALCLALLIGCDSEAQSEATITFEQDAEAVIFMRSLRESLSQRVQPNSADIQRLKAIANQYPDEASIGGVLVAILPALKDWDGLAVYYEHKLVLEDVDRSMLARIYIMQANYGGARDVIQSVAKAQPDNVEANALLGRALYFYGEHGQASQFYDRVWDSIVADRRVGDITYRAMIYFDEGSHEKALEILMAGLKDSPDSIAMHNAMGRVLAAGGKVKEADAHRDRATLLLEEISRKENGQMLRASRVLALNRALQAGDISGCQRMILEFLPGSDSEFQQQLFRFLEEMYQAAGRAEEIPAALERARQAARKESR